jgi:hypothetical protein
MLLASFYLVLGAGEEAATTISPHQTELLIFLHYFQSYAKPLVPLPGIIKMAAVRRLSNAGVI